MIWGLLIYVFNFWKFRGSFLSLIFGFWKFLKCILNQNYHFWGVCFIKLFYLRHPYICFWFFGTLEGLFWVWLLVFENFEIVFWIRITTFGGDCFIKLFDLRPPYKYFWFFGTLGGLFWVRFLVFENLEIVFWMRMVGSVLYNFLIWGLLIYFFDFLEC